MKRLYFATGLLAFGAASLPAVFAVLPIASAPSVAVAAEMRTATLAVENMTCALCPVTVKVAMQGVAGVQAVDIDFDAKTATVTFDPAVASLEAISAASTNAGYPAAVKG